MKNNKIILFPVKALYGFKIKHNQPKGWHGSAGIELSWFKHEKDCKRRCEKLMKKLNNHER